MDKRDFVVVTGLASVAMAFGGMLASIWWHPGMLVAVVGFIGWSAAGEMAEDLDREAKPGTR